MKILLRNLLALTFLSLAMSGTALAQEAAIRKNLGDRIPSFKKIDEIRNSPITGLYEIRVANEVFYTNADGSYLVRGEIIDTKNKRNLTEERTEKLNAIEFSTLPIKDAFTLVRGNGKRKLAVFEDPNCGYCKRFEQDMAKINDVTVYLFLYPILSADSHTKSQNIWCAKDKAQAWNQWMQQNNTPAPAQCDASAVQRNLEFGSAHRITGTPTLLFPSGARVPGALPTADVEKLLAGK